MCDQAKAVCKAEGIDALQESAACSRRMTMHYSFDYAQQVHLPSNPLQPGPIFFLVPRKAGLFGVCCEGLPRQVNFLIDKAHLISKGSNVVVSFLHHFFERYGLGETDVHLHCDNCSVQNKNKFVLWYIAWRVAVGLHKSITLNFLVAGHTKFAPDWCFGLVKHSDATASCNEAAVVGTEDGHNNIPVMDWQGHFAGIGRDFHGIKQYQHFRFDWQHPGVVFFKTRISDEEGSFKLFKDSPLPTTAATPITPPGLSRERQAYLYENIRPFVEDEFKDVVCPPPASRATNLFFQ
ncbi:hypothetical protein CAPTEDRAFT_192819 [Capitella teleta]|uniref:DUF7869 domain-containing protein n=1 Tax=Capitella teleta TaxID=283909 RepID=R7T404_CAPTE|nr:hypothetical protein CAPTEDRAFT_192819 [Capitella teleta]|eukprot:ELT87533.1 hypothetical protein CAPTEDRAFT_192819 [Capitella teleta]